MKKKPSYSHIKYKNNKSQQVCIRVRHETIAWLKEESKKEFEGRYISLINHILNSKAGLE